MTQDRFLVILGPYRQPGEPGEAETPDPRRISNHLVTLKHMILERFDSEAIAFASDW